MESGSKKGCKPESSEDAVSSPGAEEPPPPPPGVASPSAPAPATPATARAYYECVFCKRGFTTAQALGGHMNIHRRDRAPKPGRDAPAVMTTVSRNIECYNQYRHLAYPAVPPAATSVPTSSGMYYRGAAHAAAGVEGETATASHSSGPSPRELSLFGEAGRHGRGGDGSPALEGSSERQAGEPEREVDLDLELRLGHRPRH